MKLAASNIGWLAKDDHEVLSFLQAQGFSGLEVAPGRVVEGNPYDHWQEASDFAKKVHRDFGLKIASMQSIWFGRQENIFRSKEERETLLKVTFKAIDFVSAMECTNLVFGCPGQRNMEPLGQEEIAKEFFLKIGDYAASHGVVFALEANPPIYHTNFMNHTKDVLEWASMLNHPGIAVNLDIGTMVENKESAELLQGKVNLIHHVHLSHPYLEPVPALELHNEVKEGLQAENYKNYVSLEMKAGDLIVWKKSAAYLAEVFQK